MMSPASAGMVDKSENAAAAKPVRSERVSLGIVCLLLVWIESERVGSDQTWRSPAFANRQGRTGEVALRDAPVESRLDPADLEVWGWTTQNVFAPLEEAGGQAPPKPVLNSYTFQRKVMLALRKDIRKRPHGKVVERLRYYCDVLLRESL